MTPLKPASIIFRPVLTARHGSVEARVLDGAGSDLKTATVKAPALVLTRQEACLLHALHDAQGKVVERRALHSALNSEAETDNLLSQVVRHLRSKLEASGVGLEIHTVHGRGYQMGTRA